MILSIKVYPDPILKKKSLKVTQFDEELHTLLENMYDTMMEKNGIGLAAVQVGIVKQVLILNLPTKEGEEEVQQKENTLELINPIITAKSGSQTYQEGCLSVPEYYDDIERAASISLEYQDRHGNAKTLNANELLSVAIQHEMDHLEGHLFVEKLSLLKRKKFEKEWKKKNRSRKKF
jgi:peptide deformylase